MNPQGNSAITSKLNTLLRMGLVSKNNVRRAQMLFLDPERAMKNPAYRLLMQEILVDVIDRVVNNKTLYSALRSTLAKDQNSSPVTEGVEEDRTKSLLRSGLVKKKDILAARRALKSKSTAKSMSAVKVYREMMIDMMDMMAKKITGSPVLFNAFKQTLGKEEMEESFEVPNAESIVELLLHEDATELLEKNVPTKPDLWARAKSKARSKFDVYPSAYANGWAVKWYNEQGGGWKSTNECKTFFEFSKGLDEAWGAAAQGKAWWQTKTRAELDALAKSASEARRGEEDEKRKRHAAWNKTQKWSSITGKKPVKEEIDVDMDMETGIITESTAAMIGSALGALFASGFSFVSLNFLFDNAFTPSNIKHEWKIFVRNWKDKAAGDKMTGDQGAAMAKELRALIAKLPKKSQAYLSGIVTRMQNSLKPDENGEVDKQAAGKFLRTVKDKISNVKNESVNIDEGSAVPSRKEALAAIRWGKKAMKDPAKHGVTPEDIRANMQVARDTIRPFGAKRKSVKEARWEGSAAQAKLKKAKAEYERHAAEIKKPIPPSRGSYHPMARYDPKTGKTYWAKDRRKKAGTGNRRATDADYRSDSTTE